MKAVMEMLKGREESRDMVKEGKREGRRRRRERKGGARQRREGGKEIVII